MEKIKIEQYLVRGKHRNFHVLKFPELEYAWAYWDWDTERYVIDGSHTTFQYLNYAMAALIAAPDMIAYFPIRKKGPYYVPNYDAVLTRVEGQLRRSEWVHLRRQLDRAHQIQNFCLRYNPQKLYDYMEGFRGTDQYYRAMRQRKQEVNTLLGDTVFFTLIKETCYAYHRDTIDMMDSCDHDLDYGLPVDGFDWYSSLGWFLPDRAIHEMINPPSPRK